MCKTRNLLPGKEHLSQFETIRRKQAVGVNKRENCDNDDAFPTAIVLHAYTREPGSEAICKTAYIAISFTFSQVASYRDIIKTTITIRPELLLK